MKLGKSQVADADILTVQLLAMLAVHVQHNMLHTLTAMQMRKQFLADWTGLTDMPHVWTGMWRGRTWRMPSKL